MPSLSSKELAYISTIIKASAATVDWSKDLGAKDALITVQEVQCMQINDNIYIAANPGESAHVKAFLERFGVSNYLQLQNCLRYSHNLLIMDNPKRKTKSKPSQHVVGKGYTAKYSEQDLKVIKDFVAKKPAFITPFDNEALDTINTLITTTRTDPDELRLSWFIRKFIKESEPQGAKKASGSPNAYLSKYSLSSSVNLIQSEPNVHAELLLLRLLTEAVIADRESFKGKTIHIGGAKKACANCATWIKHFRRWMLNRFEVTLAFPIDEEGGDNRAQANGAGIRPSSSQFVTYGIYGTKLFNGEANNELGLAEAFAEETPVESVDS
ncbi:hypothetical protein [Paraburkholderia bannensis]|uniref:hypothetical protein n=1 Tax=Paraburkholderia bannensis TaxID=765414 RepID=UPI002AB77D2C|nr:hypothetical protein [Paraburkholderia bannensis]